MPINANNVLKSADKILEGNLSEQQIKVLQYVKENETITSRQTEILLQVKQRRARAVLKKMVDASILEKHGAYKNTVYAMKEER